LKRSVLKSVLKAVKVTVLRVEDGSRFHRAGTAVENEFLQKFDGAKGGSMSGAELERSDRDGC